MSPPGVNVASVMLTLKHQQPVQAAQPLKLFGDLGHVRTPVGSHFPGAAKEPDGVVHQELFPRAGTLPPACCGSRLGISTSLPHDAAQRTDSHTCLLLPHPSIPPQPCPWLPGLRQNPGPWPLPPPRASCHHLPSCLLLYSSLQFLHMSFCYLAC